MAMAVATPGDRVGPRALLLLLVLLVRPPHTCSQEEDGPLQSAQRSEHPEQPQLVAPWWLDERLERVFAPVTRIDIVDGENEAPPPFAPLLRNRTVRWYAGADPTEQCSDRRAPPDECRLRQDDRAERFRLQWGANAYGGYIIFWRSGNLATLLAGYACLFDPTGTYLLLLAGPAAQWQRQESTDATHLLALLRLIWSERGAFRVFVQLPTAEIVTYDPFYPPADPRHGYGALVSLTADCRLPRVPVANFRGYPVRVEVFRSVYSTPVAAAAGSGYRGADVTARDVFQRALNVTVVHVAADKDLFGDRQPNGSFTGALGRLVRREVDIVFTGFFIKDYGTRDVEFSASLYADAVCCLVRKASRIPEALLPLYIFPADIWALLLLLGVLCSLVWCALRAALRHIHRRYHRAAPLWSRRHRLAVLFNLSGGVRRAPPARQAAQLLVDAFILLLSAPYQRFTRAGTERLFLAGLLLVSLVFVSLYQSGLAAVFVNPLYHPDINTLRALEATGMPIPVKYRGFLDDVFPVNYSRLMDALRARMQHLRVPESMLALVARHGTIATVTRRTTLALDNAIYMTTRQLHLVPECPRTYNLAYVTPHRSALGERFNRVLLRLVGGGLVDHWIDETRYEWTLRDRPLVQRMVQSDFKVLTVLDMQFAFYVLAIGLAFSAGTIALELLRHARQAPTGPAIRKRSEHPIPPPVRN